MLRGREIFIGLVALFFLVSEAYAQCTQPGRTVGNTPVYDRAPIFFTGSGWQLGTVLETLPANTRVMICERVQVGFFFDKKGWYRVQYETNKTGWIYSGDLRTSLPARPKVAWASAPYVSIAEASNGQEANGERISSVASYGFYGFVFFVILLGMFGKVVFDELDRAQGASLKSCFDARKCLKAIIAAPIVFLTFLKAGNFSVQDEFSLMITMCFAFQNGFFWQTFLPTRPR